MPSKNHLHPKQIKKIQKALNEKTREILGKES